MALGMYELKLYRLAKCGCSTENYAIITQGQWELEFPNLIAEEENSELNGTITLLAAVFYLAASFRSLFRAVFTVVVFFLNNNGKDSRKKTTKKKR